MAKKYVKLLSAAIILAMVFTLLAGCGGAPRQGSEGDKTAETKQDAAKEQPKVESKSDVKDGQKKYEKHYKFTASSPFFLETGVDYMDKLSKKILENFNMTLEAVPVSLSDFNDKNRVWISSGDMPDIVHANLIYPDYKQFVEQELVRALPDDYETKYPNMAKAIAATGIDKPLKERHGGKLYCAPKPIFFDPFVKPFGDHTTIYYRKDWAEKLGLPVKDMYTIEEVMNMARTFMEKDPNSNGPGKTIGLAIEPSNMMTFFARSHNSGWNAFYKKDGKYVWGPAHPESLEGLKALKKYYKDGIVYKDFFTIKVRGEVEAMFNAGLTGLMWNGGAFGNVKRLYGAFGKENPDKDPYKSIGIANLLGPDNKIHSFEFMNLQSISYFNPNMEDDKYERILDLIDYVATPDVQNLIHLGFEGEDYKKNGDKIEITRKKGKDGNPVPMAELYPSYYLWGMLIIAWDDFTVRDPSTDPRLIEANKKLWTDRTNNGNMLRVDYDLTFFTAPNYNKAVSITNNVHNDFTEIIVKNDDVETAWKQYVKENEKLIGDALNELNSQLAK